MSSLRAVGSAAGAAKGFGGDASPPTRLPGQQKTRIAEEGCGLKMVDAPGLEPGTPSV